MDILTRNTDYAVNALCHIAEKNRVTSVREICDALDIPRPFIRGILQRLAGSGILKSTKGHGGGFELALPAETISLLALMEIFQESEAEIRCIFRKASCTISDSCRLRKKLIILNQNIRSQAQSITIASLMEDPPVDCRPVISRQAITENSRKG